MCFSPEVDLVAGTAIVGVGADAFVHTDDRRQLPLAALPVVLGVHQMTESLVWWGLDGAVPDAAEQAALWGYLVIALLVLPVLVPAAAGRLEAEPRRWIWQAFTALGVAVAAALLYALVRGPVSAEIRGWHLEYSVGVPYGPVIVAGYLVATCGSMLASDIRALRVFGAVILAGAAVVGIVRTSAFESLWCVWAAIASVAIAAHLRRTSPASAATTELGARARGT